LIHSLMVQLEFFICYVLHSLYFFFQNEIGTWIVQTLLMITWVWNMLDYSFAYLLLTPVVTIIFSKSSWSIITLYFWR
jgi:hypothetical protein